MIKIEIIWKLGKLNTIIRKKTNILKVNIKIYNIYIF